MKKMIVLTRSAGSQVRNIGKYYKILYTFWHIVHYLKQYCTYCTVLLHIVHICVNIAQIRTILLKILYNTIAIFCLTLYNNSQIVSKYVQKTVQFWNYQHNITILCTIRVYCTQNCNIVLIVSKLNTIEYNREFILLHFIKIVQNYVVLYSVSCNTLKTRFFSWNLRWKCRWWPAILGVCSLLRLWGWHKATS